MYLVQDIVLLSKKYLDTEGVYGGYYWSTGSNADTATQNNGVQDALSFLINNNSDNSVRVTNETPRRVSVFDIIRNVTEVDNPRVYWTRLCAEHIELVTLCNHLQFPGAGQRPTPVTDARGAVTIINFLPGRKAAQFRAQGADVLVRYLGGDETLVAEIKRNRELQEQLPEDHPARLFGEDVEATQERYQLQSANMNGVYLDSFIGKKVVYLVVFCHEGTYYIKFGKSEVCTKRMNTHLGKFPNASIYCMYEVQEIKKVEDTFKQTLRYRDKLTDIVLDGQRFIEIIKNT